MATAEGVRSRQALEVAHRSCTPLQMLVIALQAVVQIVR
jgi:hypothetical protein